jgi:hypothetical protein
MAMLQLFQDWEWWGVTKILEERAEKVADDPEMLGLAASGLVCGPAAHGEPVPLRPLENSA